MKLKMSILVFIIILSNIIYGSSIFSNVVNEKSLKLTKQEQYRLDNYLNNRSYKEIALVKSSITKDLLSLSELSFITKGKTEYIFPKKNR